MERNIIMLRAWDGNQWWYEGGMNGFYSYLCRMEKKGQNWIFIRNGAVVESSGIDGSKLQYRIGDRGEWLDAQAI